MMIPLLLSLSVALYLSLDFSFEYVTVTDGKYVDVHHYVQEQALAQVWRTVLHYDKTSSSSSLQSGFVADAWEDATPSSGFVADAWEDAASQMLGKRGGPRETKQTWLLRKRTAVLVASPFVITLLSVARCGLAGLPVFCGFHMIRLLDGTFA